MATPEDITIRRGAASDIDRLEHLWVAVHHQHADVMPELAPYVTDAQSWKVRRTAYQRLLARPGSVLLLAERAEDLVGYGLAYVLDPDEDWISDTWVTAERVAEIESLSVRREDRGAGIGSLLLSGLERALADQDVQDLVIGLLPGNDGALRLYQSRGFRPTWLYMSRFTGR